MEDSDDVVLTFDDDIEIHLPTQAIVNALIVRLLTFVPWLFTLDGDFDIKTRRFVFKKMIIALLNHLKIDIPSVPEGQDWINTVIVSGITQSTAELTANPWPIEAYTYVNEKNRIVYKVGGLSPITNTEENTKAITDDAAIAIPTESAYGQDGENQSTGQNNGIGDNRSRQDNSGDSVDNQNEETIQGSKIIHFGYKERPERQSNVIWANFDQHRGT